MGYTLPTAGVKLEVAVEVGVGLATGFEAGLVEGVWALLLG